MHILKGKVMSDYKIRIGRQEFNTKCSYDAVQGFEHLLSLADNLGIDVHSIAFTGGSAGGGEINYRMYVCAGNMCSGRLNTELD